MLAQKYSVFRTGPRHSRSQYGPPGRQIFYHMTGTAPRAISQKTTRKKFPYEGRARQGDRAGKTRTAPRVLVPPKNENKTKKGKWPYDKMLIG